MAYGKRKMTTTNTRRTKETNIIGSAPLMIDISSSDRPISIQVKHIGKYEHLMWSKPTDADFDFQAGDTIVEINSKTQKIVITEDTDDSDVILIWFGHGVCYRAKANDLNKIYNAILKR